MLALAKVKSTQKVTILYYYQLKKVTFWNWDSSDEGPISWHFTTLSLSLQNLYSELLQRPLIRSLFWTLKTLISPFALVVLSITFYKTHTILLSSLNADLHKVPSSTIYLIKALTSLQVHWRWFACSTTFEEQGAIGKKEQWVLFYLWKYSFLFV